MRKRTKLLVMMLLGVLLSINQVWGEEKTHTFSSFTATDGVATITDNPLTIVLDKKTNSAPPAWVSSASEARLYAAGTLTISCEQTITKIVYNYTVNANKSGTVPTIDGVSGSTNAGTWNAETKTWTGSDTEVTFSTSGSAGNVGFTSITVTYGSSTTYTDYLTECGAPQRTLYVQLPSDWYADAKYATYYWGGASSGWSDWMTTEYSCGEQVRSAEIPEDATYVAFVRFNSDTDVPGAVGKEWNRTGDLSVNAEKDYYHTLSKGGDNKYYGTWGNYTQKMTISYTMNGHGDAIADDCVTKGGTLASLPAAPKCAGYIFEGWFTDNTTFHNAFTTSTVVNTNIEVFAKWTAVPNRTIYLKLNQDWAAAEAKYAIHYFTNGTGWSQFMTKGTGCYDGYYYTEIPGTETDIVVGRFNPSKASTGNWDDKWNQTQNLSMPLDRDLATITTKVGGSGEDKNDYKATFSVFSLPTYTISFVGGDGATGSMDAISNIACGSSQTIPANGFGAPAGKKFNGWKDQDENNYSAGATINPVTKDLTLTAQWADVPTWTITLNAGTGSVSSTSVNIEQGQAYGSSLPAAEPCPSAASNGWTFAGWSTTEVSTQTATAPTFVKSTDVPGANIPLYAVYTSTAETGRLNKYKIYANVGGTKYYMTGVPTKIGSSTVINTINSTTTSTSAQLFYVEDGSTPGQISISYKDNGERKYLFVNKQTSNGNTSYNLQGQAASALWTRTTGTKGSYRVTDVANSRGLIFRTKDNSNNYYYYRAYATSNVTADGTQYYDLEFEDAGYDPVGETVYHSSPSCAEVYAIAVDNSVDGCDAASANVATAAAGATITLSQTTNSCYTFNGWTIKKTSDMSDVTSEVGLSSNSFTMPAYGVTAVPTYAKKQYTITLHDGASTQTPSVDCGEAFSFSTYNPTPSCSDVEFVGWTATPPTDGGWASAPATVSNIASVTAAAEYYAVYGEATGAASWQKVTSMSGVVSGETYLIVYNDGSTKKSMNKNFDTDGYGSTGATITDNKVTGGHGKASQWQLIKSGTKYAFKNVDSGKYLGQSGMGLSQEDALWANWSITMNGETEVDIVYNGNHLVYNVGDYPFTSYSSASGDIYLFKSTKAVAYKATDACAAYHTITINTTGSSVVTTAPADKAKAGDEVTISTALAAGEEIISQEVTSTCGEVTVTKGAFTMPDCDVTIKTVLGVSYTITYNRGTAPAAGASLSGSVAQQKKPAGENVVLANAGFTCGGYTLSGWATADGGEKVYDLGGSYSADANVTLYPVWEAKQDTYIDEMHGTVVGVDGKMSGYYTIPILEDDDSGTTGCKTTHKKFIGWIAASNTNTDGTLKADKEPFAGGTGKAATNATYYAVWAVVNE